ncbi:FAD-binding domain-containing protein [Lactarius quietus]|nr:FAD-binding domain-containing protein [Lactarius quietus]
MFSFFLPVIAIALALSSARFVQVVHARCRNQPGDPGYPTDSDWATLNDTIGGRLVTVVPSVEACRELGCTEAQWESGIFRQTIPGAMNAYNWEQHYTPPAELCLLNGTTCAQGDVPLYAVNATTVQHIQAGILFSKAHDLRVVIKSSGHDYLGRSTAKNSLLLWTAYIRNVTFTDHFLVCGVDQGSAVTVSAGIGLEELYAATEAQNKIYVGGGAVTVSPAGGYIQGAGHSPFSPIYGLAADNFLALGGEPQLTPTFSPLVFWALRGGGAGSWGVIIDATLRTFPIFNATAHLVNVLTATVEQTGDLMTLHATHIKDWDNVRAGQYFFLGGSATNSTLSLTTDEFTLTGYPNDIAGVTDEAAGFNLIMSSRLIPNSVYLHSPSSVGAAYKRLLYQGSLRSSAPLRPKPRLTIDVGQVSANADIDSAILPAWRTAKTHIVATQYWDDSLSAPDVLEFRRNFTSTVRPVLADLAGGPSSGSYSNEADVLEPNFQVTFYGSNYARLERIKAIYDPNDLFIVRTGVRSEFWDADGMCTV